MVAISHGLDLLNQMSTNGETRIETQATLDLITYNHVSLSLFDPLRLFVSLSVHSALYKYIYL